MYVDMCVYVCMYMCVYVCICVCMRVYVMFMCLCVFMCFYVCIYIKLYKSVYTLAGLVGILPAYSDGYVDFLNEPRKFFKRPLLMCANYGNLCQYNKMGYYVCITLLDFWVVEIVVIVLGQWRWMWEIPSKETQWQQNIAPKTSFFIPKFAGFCTGWKLSEQWYHLKFQHPNLNILNQFFSLPDSYVYMIFSWWMGWPFFLSNCTKLGRSIASYETTGISKKIGKWHRPNNDPMSSPFTICHFLTHPGGSDGSLVMNKKNGILMGVPEGWT